MKKFLILRQLKALPITNVNHEFEAEDEFQAYLLASAMYPDWKVTIIREIKSIQDYV